MVTDPSAGTIPVGYSVWNVTDGAVKRHAGSHTWKITVGAAEAAKVGFHGVPPVAQAAHIPDPSGRHHGRCRDADSDQRDPGGAGGEGTGGGEYRP